MIGYHRLLYLISMTSLVAKRTCFPKISLKCVWDVHMEDKLRIIAFFPIKNCLVMKFMIMQITNANIWWSDTKTYLSYLTWKLVDDQNLLGSDSELQNFMTIKFQIFYQYFHINYNDKIILAIMILPVCRAYVGDCHALL